jgi:hypothetical protein
MFERWRDVQVSAAHPVLRDPRRPAGREAGGAPDSGPHLPRLRLGVPDPPGRPDRSDQPRHPGRRGRVPAATTSSAAAPGPSSATSTKRSCQRGARIRGAGALPLNPVGVRRGGHSSGVPVPAYG